MKKIILFNLLSCATAFGREREFEDDLQKKFAKFGEMDLTKHKKGSAPSIFGEPIATGLKNEQEIMQESQDGKRKRQEVTTFGTEREPNDELQKKFAKFGEVDLTNYDKGKTPFILEESIVTHLKNEQEISQEFQDKKAKIKEAMNGLKFVKNDKMPAHERKAIANFLWRSKDPDVVPLGALALMNLANDKLIDLYDTVQRLLQSTNKEAICLGAKAQFSYALLRKDPKECLTLIEALKGHLNLDSELDRQVGDKCLSIANNGDVEPEIRAQAALFVYREIADLKYMQAGIEAFMAAIKQDKSILLKEEKMIGELINSQNLDIKNQVIGMLQDVAKDVEEDDDNRVNALAVLFEKSLDPQIKKQAYEKFQSLVKDEKMHYAAEFLLESEDSIINKESIIELLFSMAQDKNQDDKVPFWSALLVYNYPNLKDLKIISKSESILISLIKFSNLDCRDFFCGLESLIQKSKDSKIKQEAVEILNLHASKGEFKGKSIEIDDAIVAASILFQSQDSKIHKVGEDALLSIVKDKSVANYIKIQGHIILLKSQQAEIRGMALNFLLSILCDLKEKEEIGEYREIIKPILQSQDPEIKKVGRDLVEQSISTGAEEEDREWCDFILDNFPESDELFQKALYLLIDMEKGSSDSIYAIHGQLLEKLKEPVIHNPLTQNLDGFRVTLNTDKIKNFLKHEKRPDVTHDDFVKLVEGIFTESKASELVQKKLNELLEAEKLKQEQLTSEAKKESLKSLLTQSSNTNIDPISHKFAEIIYHLKKLPSSGEKNELSLQSKETLQLMVNLLSCTTAQESAIEQTWNHLKGKFSLSEDQLESLINNDKLNYQVSQILLKFRSDLLNGDGQLSKILTETDEGQKVYEPEHQSRYLYKLIGEELGLHYLTQLINVDWDGYCITKALLNCSRQEVLKEYYEIYTPEAVSNVVRGVFNEHLKDHYGKTIDMLREVLGSPSKSKYFKISGKRLDPTVELTSLAVTKLLLSLGYFIEVKHGKGE